MMKIKIGKIEVDQNLNPIIFLVLMIFSLLLFLMFSINLVSTYIETKDYVKVDSVVTSIGHKHVPNTNEVDSVYHYAELEYVYNGKTYHCNKTLHMAMFYPKINSKMKIYIDPDVPTRFRDTWIVSVDIAGCIISLIFSLAMLHGYIIRRKQNRNEAVL